MGLFSRKHEGGEQNQKDAAADVTEKVASESEAPGQKKELGVSSRGHESGSHRRKWHYTDILTGAEDSKRDPGITRSKSTPGNETKDTPLLERISEIEITTPESAAHSGESSPEAELKRSGNSSAERKVTIGETSSKSPSILGNSEHHSSRNKAGRWHYTSILNSVEVSSPSETHSRESKGEASSDKKSETSSGKQSPSNALSTKSVSLESPIGKTSDELTRADMSVGKGSGFGFSSTKHSAKSVPSAKTPPSGKGKGEHRYFGPRKWHYVDMLSPSDARISSETLGEDSETEGLKEAKSFSSRKSTNMDSPFAFGKKWHYSNMLNDSEVEITAPEGESSQTLADSARASFMERIFPHGAQSLPAQGKQTDQLSQSAFDVEDLHDFSTTPEKRESSESHSDKDGIVESSNLTKDKMTKPHTPKSLWQICKFEQDSKFVLPTAARNALTVNSISSAWSPLESLVKSLAGAPVKLGSSRKKSIVWVDKELKSFAYSLRGQTVLVPVVDIETLKAHDKVLKVKIHKPHRAELEKFSFTFATREDCEVFLCALTLLAPPDILVQHNGGNIQFRKFYNPMRDTYNKKFVSKKKRFGDYVLLKGIGRGAFGKVYVALHSKERVFYAVKAVKKMKSMKLEFIAKAFGDSYNAKQPNTTDREAKVMELLNHENVVSLVEILEDEEGCRMLLVVELMPCGSLVREDNVQEIKPFPLPLAIKVWVDAVNGLEYLHQNRIVHRDIKPQNLLTQPDGTVKLSDFGTSKVYTEDQETFFRGQETAVGTPAFCAPEHAMSFKAPKWEGNSYPSDVWALAVTIYIVLFGRLPFSAKNMFETYDSICCDSVMFPEYPRVPRSLIGVLSAMLEKDPAKRVSISKAKAMLFGIVEESSRPDSLRNTSPISSSTLSESSGGSEASTHKKLSASSASRMVKRTTTASPDSSKFERYGEYL